MSSQKPTTSRLPTRGGLVIRQFRGPRRPYRGERHAVETIAQEPRAADPPRSPAAATMTTECASFSCPVCFEEYTPVDRPPVTLPSCGHCVCKLCLLRIRNCGVCSEEIRMNDDVTTAATNYTLLHLKEEMDMTRQEALERQSEAFERRLADARIENNLLERQLIERNELENLVSCAECHQYEKEEKMRICIECANGYGVAETSSEEELLPFVLCACCTLDRHASHHRINYVPWKTRHIVTTTAADGVRTVGGMSELCEGICKKAKEDLDQWVSRVKSLGNLQHAAHHATMQDARDICTLVREDADNLNQLTDRALPHLRRISKVAQEASHRLNYLRNPTSGATMRGGHGEDDRGAKNVAVGSGNVARDAKKPTMSAIDADYDSDIFIIEDGEDDGIARRSLPEPQTSSVPLPYANDYLENHPLLHGMHPPSKIRTIVTIKDSGLSNRESWDLFGGAPSPGSTSTEQTLNRPHTRSMGDMNDLGPRGSKLSFDQEVTPVSGADVPSTSAVASSSSTSGPSTSHSRPPYSFDVPAAATSRRIRKRNEGEVPKMLLDKDYKRRRMTAGIKQESATNPRESDSD